MTSMMDIISNNFSHCIVALASILATYFTLKYQLKRDEIRRLHEQRKRTYDNIVNQLMDVLEKVRLQKRSVNEDEVNKKFFNVLKPLIIYGSSSVMQKIRDLRAVGNKIETNKKNNVHILYSFENLIIEIRKELNPKEDLKKGDILSLFQFVGKQEDTPPPHLLENEASVTKLPLAK